MTPNRPSRRRLPAALPAAVAILAAQILAACSPMCAAVDSMSWGSCHAEVHGGSAANVPYRTSGPVAAELADEVEQARAMIRSLMVADNLPGVSVAIGVDGRLVWAEGLGWADIAQQRPVTPDSRFRIGAVAEAMTAVAVGRLLERGAIDIDRPVQEYVPAFAEKPWPVTTRQLMAHVAGMRPLGVEERLYLRAACTGPLDAVRTYAGDSLLFEPGTRFRESTDGWKLVGAVVEAAAGEPFMALMQRELFDPLGMDATLRDEPASAADSRVFFYWPFAKLDTRTGIEHANDPDNSCQLGGDGLLTTPSDLVRFGAAMLEDRLLDPASRALLLAPVTLASGEVTGHGLGWTLSQIPVGPEASPTAAFGRDGRPAGGTSSLLLLPGPDVVVAVTSNVSYARNLPGLAARLAALFTDGGR